VPASVYLDERRAWTGAMTAAVVANGAYYPTDSCLDVVIREDLDRVELLRWLPSVYRGAHLWRSKVAMRRARTIVIDPTRPVRVNVDGEGIGGTPVRMRTCPKALRLRR
jgi:diacylglycerol kinase (ATP)